MYEHAQPDMNNSDVMAQFYEEYTKQGFRKCGCQVCVESLEHPVLIRQDANSAEFHSEH